MDKIHRIQLPPQRKGEIILERHPEEWTTTHSTFPQYEPSVIRLKSRGYWLLPLHTNKDRTLGTFLYLYDDGKIERVTIREDEGDIIDLIKPADKDCK